MKYLKLLVTVLVVTACAPEDKLIPSEEDLFPVERKSELDRKLAEIYASYNTVIEYRYVKNLLPNDWYYITPVNEELVLPMAQLLKEMWIGPLESGSSSGFIRTYFPRMLVLVGSPAYKKDGTIILGQAEGGTLIHFTEVNSYDPENHVWVRRQLATAFHEYGHLLHQAFNLPDAYRKITPDAYIHNGWHTLSLHDARIKGMVSSYAVSSVSEDFAELFSFYITQTDTELTACFNDVVNETELNKGRAILRTKLSVMKKFLNEIGLNPDLVRKELQIRLEVKNTK